MPYTLNKTDQTVLLTLADGTKDDSKTSLTFIGKNFTNYGEAFNENFLKLLEHFANDLAPAAPIIGQIWYDKNNKVLKVYQGPVDGWKTVVLINSIVGTANQVIATPTSTGVQLSLPQSINTIATPTFKSMTLSESAVNVPPLTITSTAVVNNLNADLLDGKHGSEYSDYTKLTNLPTLGDVSSLDKVELGTNTNGNYVKSISGQLGVLVQNGSGEGSMPVVRHADTSTISNTVSSSNTGNIFVKNLEFKYDPFGHTTDVVISSATESNSIQTIIIGNTKPSIGYNWVDETNEVPAGDKVLSTTQPASTIELFGGNAIDVKVDNSKKAILIEHTDTSSVTSTNNQNGNVIQNINFDSFGHVTSASATNLDNRYLTKNGGTVTGNITLPNQIGFFNPADFDAINKNYLVTLLNQQFVGTISYFARSSAPTGWLACDGTQYTQSQYPLLYQQLVETFPGTEPNTFRVPDLRGEFVRGWDNGRGVDSGRALGSSQRGSQIVADDGNELDAIAQDTATRDYSRGTNYQPPSATWDSYDGLGNIAHVTSGTRNLNNYYSASLDSNYFLHSRPRNVALLACIKADVVA